MRSYVIACNVLLCKNMRLDGKGSASASAISAVPKGSVLGTLLFILYTSELFQIVGNHIVGYADDTTIYAVFHWVLGRTTL